MENNENKTPENGKEHLSSNEAIERMVEIIRGLDSDNIAKTMSFVCGGRAEAIGDKIVFDQDGNQRFLSGSENNEFATTEELAKSGLWITVGKASIYIKQQDDGVSAVIYPAGKEDGDSVGETFALNSELSSEDENNVQ